MSRISKRPSLNKLDNLHEIMADQPRRKKTTILIPIDKWKEIKSYALANDTTIAQLFLDGYESLRSAVVTAESKEALPSGGTAA